MSGWSCPPGWSYSFTPSGAVYFIDHTTRSTTWLDPNTALRFPLPYPWQMQIDPQGCQFFMNHNTRQTSWSDPRLNPPNHSKPPGYAPPVGPPGASSAAPMPARGPPPAAAYGTTQQHQQAPSSYGGQPPPPVPGGPPIAPYPASGATPVPAAGVPTGHRTTNPPPVHPAALAAVVDGLSSTASSPLGDPGTAYLQTSAVPAYVPDRPHLVGWAGEMSRADAEAALAGKPPGTYLTRWSRESYVVSLVNEYGQFEHIGNIRRIGPGDRLEAVSDKGNPLYYDNLVVYCSQLRTLGKINQAAVRG